MCKVRVSLESAIVVGALLECSLVVTSWSPCLVVLVSISYESIYTIELKHLGIMGSCLHLLHFFKYGCEWFTPSYSKHYGDLPINRIILRRFVYFIGMVFPDLITYYYCCTRIKFSFHGFDW